jgi:hypothetical protein
VEVTLDRDWLDYAAALSGVIGAAAAIVALILARRSAKDAERSADTAERTAEAAEASAKTSAALFDAVEEERKRRPRIDDLSVSFRAHGDGLTGVFEAGLHNAGSKPAIRALINFLLPPEVGVVATGPTGTEPGIPGAMLTTREPRGETGPMLDWHYWSGYVDLFPNVHQLAHFRLPSRRTATTPTSSR